MKKQFGKRLLSWALSAAMVATTVTAGVQLTAGAKSDYKAPFDENNIALRYAVISDTHVMGSDSLNATKFRKVMAQLQTIPDLSAIVINGDVVDYGTEEQIHVVDDILEARIKKGLDLKKTKLMLNMGNHEMFDAELNFGDRADNKKTQAEAKPHYHGANTFKKILGDKMYSDDATHEEMELGYMHTELKNYHMILFSLYDYNQGLRYEQKEFEWLKKALKEANDADPEKPIFFFLHSAIKGTNVASQEGGFWAIDSQELFDELSKYPQLIAVGSHLHFPVQDEREIWQGKFTAFDTGSVAYSSVPLKMVNPITGENMVFQGLKHGSPANCEEFSQGILMEVDAQNNTRITRLDFHKTAKEHSKKILTIKEPWYVPNIHDPNHLNMYSPEALSANNTAPVFDAEDTVRVIPNDPEIDPYKNFLNIEFDTATDNDMVLAYEVKYIEKATNKEIIKQYFYSDYYLHANPEEMLPVLQINCSKRNIYPMKPNYPYDYFVEVRAVDCFGMKSEPIRSEVQPGDPTGLDETPDPSEDPQAQWGYIPFTDFNYFKPGYTPTNPDFDSWPPVSHVDDFHPFVPVSNNGFAGTPAITKRVNGFANQFDVISNSDDAILEKYYNTNCEGATEFWVWVDFSEVKFDHIYFGFREDKFYGKEYMTEVSQELKDAYFFIEDGKGGWVKKPFQSDGKMELGNYKGFVRFSVELFVNPDDGAPMFPDNIKTFKYWFSLDDNEDYTGKEFSIDQIGFAGPNIKNPTMTVAEMKSMDGSDKVTPAELKAAYAGAKSKIDAGQGEYDKNRYDNFVAAYEAAGKLVEAPGNADETFNAYMALKTAMSDLNKPAGTDKTPLVSAVEDAKKVIEAGQGSYSENSWKDFLDAYNAANAVLENAAASQEEITAATAKLKEAKAALKNEETEEPDTADRNELEKVISNTKNIFDEGQKKYSDKSWKDFVTAFNNAQVVLRNPNSTPEEIKDALDKLNTAKSGLTNADSSELKKLVDSSKKLFDEGQKKHSSKVWKEFVSAYENAQAVAANPDSTQKDIKSAFNRLTAAKAAMDDENGGIKAPLTGVAASSVWITLITICGAAALITCRKLKAE